MKLEDLKAGDSAYIIITLSSRTPKRWYEVKVSRVTPTQVVTVSGNKPPQRFRKDSGREIPDDADIRLRADCPDGIEGYQKSSRQLRNERLEEEPSA